MLERDVSGLRHHDFQYHVPLPFGYFPMVPVFPGCLVLLEGIEPSRPCGH